MILINYIAFKDFINHILFNKIKLGLLNYFYNK